MHFCAVSLHCAPSSSCLLECSFFFLLISVVSFISYVFVVFMVLAHECCCLCLPSNFIYSWILFIFVSSTYVFLHFPQLKNIKYYWLAEISFRTHLGLKCKDLIVESFGISPEQQYFGQC